MTANTTTGEILTLPPLDELDPGVPLSGATGQPRRVPVMIVAMGFLYAASVVSLAALAWAWWRAIHVATWLSSAKLVEWWQPRAGGWRSIVAAVAIFAIGSVMTAAPAIAGFNAWNGHRWSRIAALVATALCGLGFAMNPLAIAALPLAAIGAALLWLPVVGRYFSHWRAFRVGARIAPRTTPEHVVYGPLPRFQ